VAQLSNRYATAIFELSIERNLLKENLDQALLMRDVLDGEDCRSIITHPRISAKEKRCFFDEVFKNRISDDLLGFLHLAVTKNRTAFIVPSLDSFIDMAHNHLRKATALVISAVPLRDEQISALAALLSNKISKQVTIEQKVDPTVIGGLYIQVDGYFVDRTLKTRLQEIKLSLETTSDVAP
jgi:F-type H+-transporting ATPase subunit delta